MCSGQYCRILFSLSGKHQVNSKEQFWERVLPFVFLRYQRFLYFLNMFQALLYQFVNSPKIFLD